MFVTMLKSYLLLYCLCFALVESEKGWHRIKRQTISCSYRGMRYQPGQSWSFQVQSKHFSCTCSTSGIPDCTWEAMTPRIRRCYDRRGRIYRDEGSKWEAERGGRTLDCTCERNERSRRMQISCSGENRCHYKGTSYQSGDTWKSRDVTGLDMDCQCQGAGRVTCRAKVTTDIPRPAADAQWIEDHIVYGEEVIRPRITTLQACDTGRRVVSSGFTWNQTSKVRTNDFTVEKCECRDALIQCEPYRVSRTREPHCLTDDGQIKRVGETWTKLHHSHANIRWRCSCRSHGKKSCRDIGYCQDPTPPPNGGMVCVVAGSAGPDQSHYCKPLCNQGLDFFNRQRYYRIWEVCSQITHHRWSGGYAEDATLLAKCRRPDNAIRGRTSLYLPTTNCESLTPTQIEQIKLDFIRTLQRNHLCHSKCEAKWFKCGARA